MAENTEISWCTHTANLWWGCTEVHAGCDNCYARTLAHRWGFEVWGNKAGEAGGVRRYIRSVWRDLDRYQRKAAEAGVKHTVFVGSMMDIFEKPFPIAVGEGNVAEVAAGDTGLVRAAFFDKIHQGLYPNLIFLLLTKRPGNINKYIPASWKENGAPENVWFGASVVDTPSTELIGQLLQVNGKRFLSMEPLIAPVDLTPYISPDDGYCITCGFPRSMGLNPQPNDWAACTNNKCVAYNERKASVSYMPAIDWVIVGGESGPKARPMHPEWAEMILATCIANDVPVHFKQWGEWKPVRAAGLYHGVQRIDFTDGVAMIKVGKKDAGREIGGRTYDATPLTF